MPPDIVRSSPLNVLIVLAGDDVSVASMIPALRSHCTLVCTSQLQAVEAAPAFEPDVILVDMRLTDPLAAVRDLSRATGGRRVAFVAMQAVADSVPTAPPGFRGLLPLPATAGELDQLLWQFGREIAAPVREVPAPPDSSRIG